MENRQAPEENAMGPVKDTSVNIYLDTVRSIGNRSAGLTIKDVEKLIHEKYFGGSYELSVTPKKSIKGKLNIYVITLTGELPSALHTVYTFLDVPEKHLQFLLPVEFNQLYQIEKRIMIGGIYTSREYEYYSIYELDNDLLKLLFTTNNPDRERIVTGYFKDNECIDYTPDRLHFQYNEQTKDILFTGNAAKYCEPQRDRLKDDTVVKRKKVNFVFHYNKTTWELDKKKSDYFTW